MNPNTLIAIGLAGAALFFFGPPIVRWLTAKLTPTHKCLPATDAERIEMLMQMRDKDERFNHDKAKLAINYSIEALTGTLDPEPTPSPEPTT